MKDLSEYRDKVDLLFSFKNGFKVGCNSGLR